MELILDLRTNRLEGDALRGKVKIIPGDLRTRVVEALCLSRSVGAGEPVTAAGIGMQSHEFDAVLAYLCRLGWNLVQGDGPPIVVTEGGGIILNQLITTRILHDED